MKLRKWHLITIGSLIAIIVFAVAIYALKTPTDFDYDPNAADLIFDFLDKWASAGAPAIMLIGIAVALIIGIMSLRQTLDMQKREHRLRLLNEIVKWATDVFSCGTEQSFQEGEAIVRRYSYDQLDDLIANFQAIAVNSQHLSQIAVSFPSLAEEVKQLKELVEEHLALLAEKQVTVSDLMTFADRPAVDSHLKELHDHKHKLKTGAIEVLKKAGEIRTGELF